MKKLFILAALFASFTFGCSEKKSESGEHTHEDGSSHDNHDEAATQQEEITAGDTATTTTTIDSAHTHENGETHTH